jgi:hypothetical protein
MEPEPALHHVPARVCATGHEMAHDAAFRVCSRCHVARYCGRECQVKHWRDGGHKERCGRLADPLPRLLSSHAPRFVGYDPDRPLQSQCFTSFLGVVDWYLSLGHGGYLLIESIGALPQMLSVWFAIVHEPGDEAGWRAAPHVHRCAGTLGRDPEVPLQLIDEYVRRLHRMAKQLREHLLAYRSPHSAEKFLDCALRILREALISNTPIHPNNIVLGAWEEVPDNRGASDARGVDFDLPLPMEEASFSSPSLTGGARAEENRAEPPPMLPADVPCDACRRTSEPWRCQHNSDDYVPQWHDRGKRKSLYNLYGLSRAGSR